jgi:hypothetical protein
MRKTILKDCAKSSPIGLDGERRETMFADSPAALPPPGQKGRRRQFIAASNLAPLIFAHWDLVFSRNPMPLQEFMPLHPLLAVLQALLPLQALAPTQWPLASLASTAGAATAPAMNMAAAAAAIEAPEERKIFMCCSLF